MVKCQRHHPKSFVHQRDESIRFRFCGSLEMSEKLGLAQKANHSLRIWILGRTRDRSSIQYLIVYDVIHPFHSSQKIRWTDQATNAWPENFVSGSCGMSKRVLLDVSCSDWSNEYKNTSARRFSVRSRGLGVAKNGSLVSKADETRCGNYNRQTVECGHVTDQVMTGLDMYVYMCPRVIV